MQEAILSLNARGRAKGHLLAFLTVFVWGITFVSTKVLLTVVTPIEILFLRFSLGFLALFLLGLTEPVTGFSLGLNFFNALTVGILGVPGLVLLVLLQMLFV